jgi:hypothetical protein
VVDQRFGILDRLALAPFIFGYEGTLSGGRAEGMAGVWPARRGEFEGA